MTWGVNSECFPGFTLIIPPPRVSFFFATTLESLAPHFI
jgi:hypothetical protein